MGEQDAAPVVPDLTAGSAGGVAGANAQVEALAAARQWPAAVELARAVVDGGADRQDVYVALARGFVRGGKPERALAILAKLREAGALRAGGVHAELQALIEVERHADARVLAERWLLFHPDDELVARLLAKVRSPRGCPPGTDRLLDLRRAERLAAAGQPVRALRTLRQLLLENPTNEPVRLAIRGVVETLRVARRQAAEAHPGTLENGLGGLARRRAGPAGAGADAEGALPGGARARGTHDDR